MARMPVCCHRAPLVATWSAVAWKLYHAGNMRIFKLVLLVLGIAVIAFSVHRIGWAPILETLGEAHVVAARVVCLPYA